VTRARLLSASPVSFALQESTAFTTSMVLTSSSCLMLVACFCCSEAQKMQHCHAMMQQHDLLGRGDGAEQSGHGQVINLKNHHAAARAAQGGDGAEQSCRGQVINLKHTS
jgi:hypothetical protein